MMEHKVINVPREDMTSGSKNPLYPYDGVLAKTLNEYAAEGWQLLSFDWTSWRHAVLAREVRR